MTDEKWETYATMVHPALVIPEESGWEGTYEMELGTIESTHIGFEDHGIFSWAIMFKFTGSGQGTGHYTFTQEMIPVTKDVLTVVGVEKWESLKGRRVYVIRNDKYGRIVGLASVDNPNMKWMFFPQ